MAKERILCRCRFLGILVLTIAAAELGACAKSPSPISLSVGTQRPEEDAALIAQGKLPPAYRDWRLISVAHEAGDLDDLRAILGNDVAIKAYREGKVTFPEGTIVARLAWRFLASEENNKTFGRAQSFVAGPPVNGVQFMVKNSKKYASTGGWSFSQFDDGKPLTDATKLKACVDCHALLDDRDLVFTRYAP